ncbi:hypothetical protein KAI56_04690 [Candidatus Parcubacteria bacterium]|nr:hypothetical protein [Candidatus Parcubacteria bacterium]
MSFIYEVIGIIILILFIALISHGWKLQEDESKKIEQTYLSAQEGESFIRTEEWFDWKKDGRRCAGESAKERKY